MIQIQNRPTNLCISNLCCQSLQTLAKYTSQIEIAPTSLSLSNNFENLTNSIIQQFKQQTESLGLSVFALQSILYNCPSYFQLYQCHPDLISHLRRIGTIANLLAKTPIELETPTTQSPIRIVLGSPKYRKLDSEGSFSQLDRFLGQFIEIAEEFNLIICLEANSHQYGGQFWNNLHECARWVYKYNKLQLRLHIDVGCMILGEESTKSILEFEEIIGYVHVSNPFLKPLGNYRKYHEQVAKALHEARYNGVYSLEALNLTEEELRDSVKFARDIYNVT